MRRFLAFLLTFLLALSTACAETPTLTELITVYQEALELERSAAESKEKVLSIIDAIGYPSVAEMLRADDTITLQPGIYQVGKDIKVGTYRFMYEIDGGWFTRVRIGSEVNASKTDLLYDRQNFDLYDPYGMSYWFQLTEAYYRVKDGDYIVIEHGSVRVELMSKDLYW